MTNEPGDLPDFDTFMHSMGKALNDKVYCYYCEREIDLEEDYEKRGEGEYECYDCHELSGTKCRY